MNTKYILLAALVIFIGVAFYIWQSGSPVAEQVRTTIGLESDLAPVALSAEEMQALKDAGISAPSADDADTDALLSVNSSDDLDAIEGDLNDTDLESLDSGLDAIDQSLGF